MAGAGITDGNQPGRTVAKSHSESLLSGPRVSTGQLNRSKPGGTGSDGRPGCTTTGVASIPGREAEYPAGPTEPE